MKCGSYAKKHGIAGPGEVSNQSQPKPTKQDKPENEFEATIASLRRELEEARARIAELEEENAALKSEKESSWGSQLQKSIEDADKAMKEVKVVAPAKEYYDDDGVVVKVRGGLWGDKFGSFRMSADGKSGHRVKSPALPMVESQDQAQADLDAYAVKRGWQLITRCDDCSRELDADVSGLCDDCQDELDAEAALHQEEENVQEFQFGGKTIRARED